MRGSSYRPMLAASVILTLVSGAYADDANLDQAARITLAVLLGGVPAIALLMALIFCLYIRKRKRELRTHALANGIELDEEGWPVHHTRVTLSPSASSRPDQQRGTRSYSSSAGDFKAPSLEAGDSHNPRYYRSSAQPPAKVSKLSTTHESNNYRPYTSPGAF